MNCLLTILLLGTISAENVKNITIKQTGPAFMQPGPQISVVIDSVDGVDFSEDEGYTAELKDGELTVKIVGDKSMEIEIPSIVEKIELNGIFVDFKVISNVPFTGKGVNVSNVKGDIEVSGKPISNLVVLNVFGDVYMEFEPDTLILPTVQVTSVNGDIIVDFVPGNFTISSVKGDIEIKKPDVLYADSLYSYNVGSVSGSIDLPVEIENLVNVSKSTTQKGETFVHFEPSFSLLSFNRVDGLLISLGSNSVKDWGRYAFTLSYGTASKRFQYYLDVEKFLLSKGVKIGAGLSLYNYHVHSDFWKVTRGENSWQALLFKDDVPDYYKSEGFDLYLTTRIKDFGTKITYSQKKHASLSNKTNFSIFYKEKDFRENPGAYEGMNRIVKLELGYRDFARISGEYFFETPINERFVRLQADVEGKTEISPLEFYHKLSAGYTENDTFPYGFTIGGPTTLPGYPTGYFSARRFVLAHEYLIVPTNFVDFIIGVYGGLIDGKFYGDFLGGINIFNGCGVFVTRDKVSNQIKYFMRFNKRI
ncbi:MAG: hypothetical protein QMD82_02010 [bacterium]|nr:hypothetical protein [bacterium]